MKPVDAIANYGTLHRMFFARAEDFEDAALVMEGKSGEYKPISWREMAQEVRETASGLLSLGVARGVTESPSWPTTARSGLWRI